MMIALVIMALLIGLALPTYRTWIQNSQIRNAAESILNAIQLARNEAIRRNTRVQFNLPSAGNTGWQVCMPTPGTLVCSGTMIQVSSGQDGSGNARAGVLPQSSSDASKADFAKVQEAGFNLPASITFDSFGRPVDTGDIARVDITNVAFTDSDPDQRRLVIVVSTVGDVRMCDPQVPSTTPRNPRAC
jgi:type IV fimbrial biogenesis protein FimT